MMVAAAVGGKFADRQYAGHDDAVQRSRADRPSGRRLRPIDAGGRGRAGGTTAGA